MEDALQQVKEVLGPGNGGLESERGNGLVAAECVVEERAEGCV